MLGIRAVVAESYERIHRSNLVGMGILPLQFINEQNSKSLGLKGDETFEINIEKFCEVVKVKASSGVEFDAKVRLDTAPEVEYYKNNGILNFVLRKLIGGC